jgi:hypothetical protein
MEAGLTGQQRAFAAIVGLQQTVMGTKPRPGLVLTLLLVAMVQHVQETLTKQLHVPVLSVSKFIV